ncbi:hypothetical protein M9991_01165 [Chryseobacterium gallinarum]|uniref:hypothetical protein n=1 Tax=Chryseobacterium gallinarum TaxID=1324352 RepID=UPI002025A487|nr:hypothetical protein [Chryseobacterium gallinarum]MCL8535472.1 hypothetical protein [Chryseobacterium gallinarum]
MMKKIYSEKSKQNIVNTYWCFLLLNRIPISEFSESNNIRTFQALKSYKINGSQ